MKTITVRANEISQPFYAGAGSRITLTGSGRVEWAAVEKLQDALNGATWNTWPAGSTAGYRDTERGLAVRVVGTGACTVTIEEGKGDPANEGAYWQGVGGVSGGYYTARDNSQHAVTTTGSEETLLTITIPAENISADSVIVISPLWSCTNSANSKAFKITLNGQIVSSVSQTTVASFHSAHIVALRSLSSQVANNSATSSPYGVTSSTGVTTLTADLSSGATLAFIASRINGADSAALERVLVEVI